MSTRIVVSVPVSHIKVHPKNPRRASVADDELVASVVESGITTPLLVAVDLAKNTAADVLATDSTGAPWVIALDGHRRRDAAKKAKLKQVPVVIDLGLDTDTAQLKAMILANAHREDLSPVEVAESYQGLLDLGLKQADIAKAMGRKPREISTQLKVLKLNPSSQARVHTGVLTLDDAAGLLEFTDDPDVTKRLEAAAESGTDFRYQLQRARQHREADVEAAAKIADLEQAGVTQLEHAVWLKAPWQEMRRLDQVPGATTGTPPLHDGCHAYVVNPATEYQARSVIEVCTDVAKHNAQRSDQDTAEDDARAAERDARQREFEELRDAQAAAEKVRHDLVRTLAGQDLKITSALEQLLRALLPSLWELLDQYGPLERYEDLLGLDPGVRVSSKPYGPARDTAVVDHLASYAEISAASLGRHLILALASTADWLFASDMEPDDVSRAQATPYADLLQAHGYEFAGPDAQVLADLRRTTLDDAPADTETEAAS